MEDNCKKSVVILTGPTAAGKTSLSIKLAKTINGEIISADSMQVYKGMNIGTAKISASEMDGVTHHLIDVIDPADEFNVMIFKHMADECIAKIHAKGKIPVLVGGTGFYIQAVLKDVDFTDYPEDPGIKKELDDHLEAHGPEGLYERLLKADPEYAATLHQNNIKRVYKALYHFLMTGEKYSDYNNREAERESPFNYAYFVLNMDRDKLYERIDMRVDKMIGDGLVDEVKKLKDAGMTRDMVSMQGLGYKEVIDYLDGRYSYDEMVYTLKRDTRHFAKRQLTWFKRENDVTWIDKTEKSDEELLDTIINILRKKEII